MKLEKHLFLSDFQIPQQDNVALSLIYKFIPDFRPNFIHLIGDILDVADLSTFEKNVFSQSSFNEELKTARTILKTITDLARQANPTTYITLLEGNHEYRLTRYLNRSAPEIATLQDSEGYILTLPRLLQLEDLGIEWIPYYTHHEVGGVIVEHGDMARAHAGYTAKAMLDKRGKSGFSGHTHRLGMHMVTKSGNTQYWVETGSLCKLTFDSPYVKDANWQQGFAVGHFYNGLMYPTIIPILDHTFIYNGKVYK